MELDLDLDLDPDRPLCKRCYMFYSALDEAFTNDPQLRVAYEENFNEIGRRALILKSHKVPSELKYLWITAMLHRFTGIMGPTPPQQMFKARDATSHIQLYRTRAGNGMWVMSFTQEHIHCHIVRYNMLMPHSDSARYRPSSHVPPARSNPFRFVKSAR